MHHALPRLLLASVLLHACTETPAASPDAAPDVVTDVAPDAVTADLPSLTDVASLDVMTADRPDAPAPLDSPASAMDAVFTDVVATPDGSSAADASVDVPWAEGVSPEGCVMMGGGLCFVRPTEAVRTNRGTLDLGCTETPPGMTSTPSTAVIQVRNFVSGASLAGATVAYSRDDLFTGVISATSGSDGVATLALPAGVASRANFRVTAPGMLDTYAAASRIDVREPNHVMQLFAIPTVFPTLLYGALGAGAPSTGTGTLGGVIDDCNGQAMENMVVTLSSTPSTIEGDLTRWRAPTFVPGARVFYFEGDTTPVPVPRARRTVTSSNGLWVILDVPPTEGETRWYVQAWGARRAGEVRLMGETRVRVVAGAVTLPEVQAWR